MTLTVDDLHLERGGRALITDLSFVVSPGEALVLVGPNGTGKTTLLRAIAGLFTQTRGTIRVADGHSDVGPVDDISVAERCHVIGHKNALKASLTAAENLAFWGTYLGTAKSAVAARVDEALTQFDLRALASIPAGYLSAGQRRRLGLARLLVADRPLWLLDEPTVSLDSASTALFADVVNAHTAQGGSVVAATHLALGLANARELNLGRAPRDATR